MCYTIDSQKEINLGKVAEKILKSIGFQQEHYASVYEWLEDKTQIINILVEEFYPK